MNSALDANIASISAVTDHIDATNQRGFDDYTLNNLAPSYVEGMFHPGEPSRWFAATCT